MVTTGHAVHCELRTSEIIGAASSCQAVEQANYYWHYRSSESETEFNLNYQKPNLNQTELQKSI